MAKRKVTLTRGKLVEYYTDYVLTNGEAPKSIFTFAKANNFEEAEFYKFFGSFEGIEHQMFSMLFESTLNVIESAEDYSNYNAKEKLLAFYFTFFENLTANRSLVNYLLTKETMPLKNLATLKDLRKHFMAYVGNLGIEMLDVKEERVQKAQDKALQESAWAQLLITMKFWLDDTSAGFEKTDIFIEKAVNTSFELMNVKPLKSLIDFGKFVLQERAGLFTKTAAE